MGERPSGRPARRRVHPVHGRRDRGRRHRGVGGRGPGRGRPHDLAKPHGKQDWQLNQHSIWYPRTTGIWQTVWLERVPGTRLDRLQWTPTLDRWEVGMEACVHADPNGPPARGGDDLRLRVVLTAGPLLLAEDTCRVVGGEVHRRIALSDPGIDDYRNELLWSPSGRR